VLRDGLVRHNLRDALPDCPVQLGPYPVDGLGVGQCRRQQFGLLSGNRLRHRPKI